MGFGVTLETAIAASTGRGASVLIQDLWATLIKCGLVATALSGDHKHV